MNLLVMVLDVKQQSINQSIHHNQQCYSYIMVLFNFIGGMNQRTRSNFITYSRL